jgi:hypothetical protein
MKGLRERDIFRLLHLLLSVPILGYFYGPVEHIPQAAFFARWLAMPIVLLSGLWMWLKPRIAKRVLQSRRVRDVSNRDIPSASMKDSLQ